MAHEHFYIQQQSHETLTIILVVGGVSGALAVVLGLYLRWKGRHHRNLARLARDRRKAPQKRRKR